MLNACLSGPCSNRSEYTLRPWICLDCIPNSEKTVPRAYAGRVRVFRVQIAEGPMGRTTRKRGSDVDGCWSRINLACARQRLTEHQRESGRFLMVNQFCSCPLFVIFGISDRFAGMRMFICFVFEGGPRRLNRQILPPAVMTVSVESEDLQKVGCQCVPAWPPPRRPERNHHSFPSTIRSA